MTAGRGIQHEENPPAGTIAHTLQLWVNLPAAEKMAVPRYQDLVASALPVRNEDGIEIRVFSGAYGDMVSTTLNHHPVTMLEVRVENDGAFRHSFSATDNAFVYVLEARSRSGPVTFWRPAEFKHNYWMRSPSATIVWDRLARC